MGDPPRRRHSASASSPSRLFPEPGGPATRSARGARPTAGPLVPIAESALYGFADLRHFLTEYWRCFGEMPPIPPRGTAQTQADRFADFAIVAGRAAVAAFAAAHASTFGIQQVATRLHDRFALLTRGRRTALPRHRTLRAVLDWSYELLSEAERLLLRHLGIFSGGFTVEAAAAVVNDGVVNSSSVMEGIANVVAMSLVALDRDTPSRWYLLDTIRAYTLEKLEDHGERDRAARCHATYFRDLFPRSPPASGAGVSKADRTGLDREMDNVRVALNWCFSVGGDRTLGVDLTAGYALWSRVDLGISLFDETGSARQSPDLLTKALDTAEALDNLDAQARALMGLYNHHIFRAEHEKGWVAAERLSHVASRIGDGFASALRRSELVGLEVEHATWTGDGLKLRIERSKTDAQAEGAEIAIPRGRADDTCPVTALKTWLELSEITVGPLFRKVNRGGVVECARLTTDAVRQILLKRAAKAGLKGTLAEPFSPHGLRAGFVTTAYRNGFPDEEIMSHTRHRSLTTMRSYVRRAKLSRESPAGKLGL